MLCNYFLSLPACPLPYAFLLPSCLFLFPLHFPPPLPSSSLRVPLLLRLPAASPALAWFLSLLFSSDVFPSSFLHPSPLLFHFPRLPPKPLVTFPAVSIPPACPNSYSPIFSTATNSGFLVSPPLLLIAFPSSSSRSSSSVLHPLILFPAFDGSPASSVIHRPLSSFHHSFLLHLSSSAVMHQHRLCFLAVCLRRDVAMLQPCSDSPGPPSVARLWWTAPHPFRCERAPMASCY